ncbi:hypothetical protein CC78DRAFT_529087 [Lojkania enalia]|uniref:Uncharacterized protein n=1 Tax=Lojkania enalia TaxID=147567 RepID=A0A9P4NB62_9PLEO|nr:hypothetical protein CC78DRAFT_529087 [Didymosphaeria enalia]
MAPHGSTSILRSVDIILRLLISVLMLTSPTSSLRWRYRSTDDEYIQGRVIFLPAAGKDEATPDHRCRQLSVVGGATVKVEH